MESENIRAKCQYHLEELPPHPQDCHAIPQAPIHWQLYPKKNNKKKQKDQQRSNSNTCLVQFVNNGLHLLLKRLNFSVQTLKLAS